MAVVDEGSVFPLILPTLAVAVGVVWAVCLSLRRAWPQHSNYVDPHRVAAGCVVMLSVALIVAAYGAHSLTNLINEWLATMFFCLLYVGLVELPIIVLATRFKKCNMIWVTLGVVPVVLLIEFLNSGSPTFEIRQERWLRFLPIAVPYISLEAIAFCIGARIPIFHYGATLGNGGASTK